MDLLLKHVNKQTCNNNNYKDNKNLQINKQSNINIEKQQQ